MSVLLVVILQTWSSTEQMDTLKLVNARLYGRPALFYCIVPNSHNLTLGGIKSKLAIIWAGGWWRERFEPRHYGFKSHGARCFFLASFFGKTTCFLKKERRFSPRGIFLPASLSEFLRIQWKLPPRFQAGTKKQAIFNFWKWASKVFPPLKIRFAPFVPFFDPFSKTSNFGWKLKKMKRTKNVPKFLRLWKVNRKIS